MTDQLALLREEIQTEMAMRQQTVDSEKMRVAVLQAVLNRIDRIEREHPATPADTPAQPRAPRRNLQDAILAMMATGHVLSLDAIKTKLELTELVARRSLDGLVRKGLIFSDAHRAYRVVGVSLAAVAQ